MKISLYKANEDQQVIALPKTLTLSTSQPMATSGDSGSGSSIDQI